MTEAPAPAAAVTRATGWRDAPQAAPDGSTLVAIGDVHGHAAELQALHALVEAEAAARPAERHVVIHLGDYIDRGPDPLGVLDHVARPLHGVHTAIALRGNHEQFLLDLLDDTEGLTPTWVRSWVQWGGGATLAALGLDPRRLPTDRRGVFLLRDALEEQLGPARLALLRGLPLLCSAGGYVFAHAGIDPTRALDEQEPDAVMNLREPFLSAAGGWPAPYCVVHGHSIAMPAVRAHRIGVDAGCFERGALCAVQLRGRQLRFLGATVQPGYDWVARLPGDGLDWQPVSAA